jgi:hypothetical protein
MPGGNTSRHASDPGGLATHRKKPDQQKVAGILDAVHSLLSRQIGISVCDVEVIRPEHF